MHPGGVPDVNERILWDPSGVHMILCRSPLFGARPLPTPRPPSGMLFGVSAAPTGDAAENGERRTATGVGRQRFLSSCSAVPLSWATSCRMLQINPADSVPIARSKRRSGA